MVATLCIIPTISLVFAAETAGEYIDRKAEIWNLFFRMMTIAFVVGGVIAEHEVETFPEVQGRVLDMVNHVVEKHKNENVILVTHMDPIKSMLAKVMDLRPKTLFELVIENASLTIINEQDGKFSPSAINAMDVDRYYQA